MLSSSVLLSCSRIQLSTVHRRNIASFVIHLPDRVERWRQFQERAKAANLSVEEFAAVDTRTMEQLHLYKKEIAPQAWEKLTKETLVSGYRLDHGDLTPGAVGCWLSHRGVIQTALERDYSTVAIFEDDANIPVTIQTDIHALIQSMDDDTPWDCLLLGWSGDPPTPEDHRGVQTVQRFWGLHAYLLSASGMTKARDILSAPIYTHVDHALSRAAAEGQFTIYGVSENRLLQQSKGSDIQMPLQPSSSSSSSPQTNK